MGCLLKKLLRGLIKGTLFGAVLLASSLAICLAAGLADIPRVGDGQEEGQSYVPSVQVVTPETELSGTADQTGDEEKTGADCAEVPESAGGSAGIPESAGDSAAAPDETTAENGPAEPMTLLFAGDLFLTDLLQSKYSRQGISAAASEGLLEVLEGADCFMLNQEFPFGTTGEAAADKEYTFRVNPSFVSVLEDLSVDIVTLANNHMLDYGRSPLTETLAALDGAGILHVGAGENLEEAKALKTFGTEDFTVGFLGASRVVPEYSWNASSGSSGVFTTYDASALVKAIQEAEAVCDFTVVYVHWGVERSTEPEEYQRTLARQYIDAGADAVIGAHPHVLQGIEYYQGKPIFYSLGNFIFNNGTYESMLVELTVGGAETAVRLIPCASEANCMRLLPESGREAFYNSLETLSSGISIGTDGTVKEE